MSASNDRARVQNLLSEGRITAAEADILFAALGDIETEADAERDDSSEDDDTEGASTTSSARVTPEQAREEARAKAHETAERAREKAREARARAQETNTKAPDMNVKAFQLEDGTSGYPTNPPQPPHAESPMLPQPPTPPVAPQQTSNAPHLAGVRWAKISGFCGDLDVRSDPNISEPSISGSASFNWDGKVFEIRTPPKDKDKEGGRNWLNRLHRAAGDLKVTLPEGMALELAVAAGDGSVRSVREVRGNFTGGDFNVYDAETLDLTVTAGDVSIGLRPTSGRQRLRATSGDIDLVLLEGSSVKVSGKATCGDLTLPQGFNRDGGFGTQRFNGMVGAGDAELELRLTAGDVDVKLERL